MAEGTPRQLTAEEAKAKIVELRDLAKHAMSPEHRIMLDHMAGTWERIARSLENGG